MKFKIDENMKRVARENMMTTPETVAFDLYMQMVAGGLLHVKNIEPGMCVLRATGPRYVSDICSVLGSVLYGDKSHPIPTGVYDAFCKLVLIPDDWCAYCGSPHTYTDGPGSCHCSKCGRMFI